MDNLTRPHKISWILWTIWSVRIRDKREEDCSLTEFTDFVINTVRQRDPRFRNVSPSENILTIQPKKVSTNGQNDEVHIVGTLFKPGQRQGGKTWTLIAEKDLASLLKSDHSLPTKGLNDLFIVIGGTINPSSRQVCLNRSSETTTRIIRFANTSTCTPTIRPFESIKHFVVPYKTREETVHIFKLRPKPDSSSGMLKSFPRKPRTLQTSQPARLNQDEVHETLETNRPTSSVIQTSGPSNKTPKSALNLSGSCSPKKRNRVRFSITANTSSSVEKPTPPPNETSSANKRHKIYFIDDSSTQKRQRLSTPLQAEEDSDANVRRSNRPTNKNNSSSAAASRDESPTHNNNIQNDQNGNISSRGVYDFGKQSGKYTYQTLKDLYNLLTVHKQGLRNANLWGVVDEVVETPTDAEFKGLKYPGNMEKAAKYSIKISDETKANVIVRLCTEKTDGIRINLRHQIGPRMKPRDIIQIHRATIQFEAENKQEGGRVKEMVVSTSPHWNYTLYNYDPNVDGPIIYQRSAKGDPNVEANKARIKCLRQFIKAGSTSEVTSTSQETPSPLEKSLNGPSSSRTKGGQETPIAVSQRQSSSRRITSHVNSSPPTKVMERKRPMQNDNNEVGSAISQVSSTHGESVHGESQRESQNNVQRTEDHVNNTSVHENTINPTPNSESDLTTDTLGSQEFTAEQVVYFLRFSSPPACRGPIKLEKVNWNRRHPFHLICYVCDMMELPGDKLVLRISDDTMPFIQFKQLITNATPGQLGTNAGPLFDVPFVDVLISNISENPAIRERATLAVGTKRVLVFLYIRTEMDNQNGIEMITLRGDARRIGLDWFDEL